MTLDSNERERIVGQARAALAERLGVDRTAIEVRSVSATEFRDTSLGVPIPNEMYAQVITPGLVVRLAVGEKEYEVHGSRDRVVLASAE